MFEEFYNNLKETIEMLKAMNKREIKEISKLVDEVIKYKITDENTIGHVFDRMLDLEFIEESEIKNLYFKLLGYSEKISKDLSYDYKKFYDEKYNDIIDEISLDEYKDYLIDVYRHECDNRVEQKLERMSLLEKNYNDEYLESVIEGTNKFIDKVIKITENNYNGYIKIPLEKEPNIEYINLNLTGGWMSDTIVRDTDNNFYSVGLLKRTFSDFFSIEPCKIEYDEEYEGDEDFLVVSVIPSYYLYIQCKKEIIENVKEEKVLRITKR